MKPNVFSQKCPSRAVLELVANKWTVLVMHALNKQTLRYAEIHKTIEGISQKMLTQTLRGMERDGMLARTVYPVVPPKVEYSLTSLGFSLLAACEQLTVWSETHLHEVMAARARYEKMQTLA